MTYKACDRPRNVLTLVSGCAKRVKNWLLTAPLSLEPEQATTNGHSDQERLPNNGRLDCDGDRYFPGDGHLQTDWCPVVIEGGRHAGETWSDSEYGRRFGSYAGATNADRWRNALIEIAKAALDAAKDCEEKGHPSQNNQTAINYWLTEANKALRWALEERKSRS